MHSVSAGNPKTKPYLWDGYSKLRYTLWVPS